MLSHKYNFHKNIDLITYYVHNMFILICYHTNIIFRPPYCHVISYHTVPSSTTYYHVTSYHTFSTPYCYVISYCIVTLYHIILSTLAQCTITLHHIICFFLGIICLLYLRL